MSDNVRRIRLGDTRYRLKPLTREQKLLLNKAHYVAIHRPHSIRHNQSDRGSVCMVRHLWARQDR